MKCSFCFRIDSFNQTRTLEEQTGIIESFSYMGFKGAIRLKNAEETFVVHELWSKQPQKLLRIYLGRFVRPFKYCFDIC
jgi:tRNA (guanine10-N2)-methyltransferase